MIKSGDYKEEQEKNISKTYTQKQWAKIEQEAREYIDKIFNLENSSMAEQVTDIDKVESSNLSFPT